MAISKVQSKSSQTTGVTSASVVFTSNCAAGNLLIYGTGAGNGTGITAATDNNTNTIALAKAQAGTTPAGDCRVDYVANSNAGACTVTCHATGSSDMHLHIWEVSGVTTTSPLRDTGSVASSATGSVTTAGSTTVSGDADFAFFQDDPNGDTLTADGSFTWNEFSTKAAGDSALSELKQATASGSQTATVSGNGTNVMSQIIATFIAASAAATPKFGTMRLMMGVGN
jgi:hypothetical protein